MSEAAQQGTGAIGLQGVLIDRAHVLLAAKILRRAGRAGVARGQ
jgi:citrate lyase beta subunit